MGTDVQTEGQRYRGSRQHVRGDGEPEDPHRGCRQRGGRVLHEVGRGDDGVQVHDPRRGQHHHRPSHEEMCH